MEKKYMQKLVGRYCKIVTREPGEDRASVVTGILEDVDYEDGFILVNSDQGLGCLRINTIIAIKPGHKKIGLREKKSLKKDEKGMIGIGTLIVFIAMVLVAAVAASVLIQTTQTLQQKAYKVGGETIDEVSSGIRFDDSIGYTNANRTHIQFVAFTITTRAGSGYIDLENVFVTLQNNNLTVLHFDENIVASNVSHYGVFHTLDNSLMNSTKFGVIAIHDNDYSISTSHGMNFGDSAFIIVNISAAFSGNTSFADTGLEPRQEISGSIMPEIGVPASFDIKAPVVFLHRIVDLY
jgi:flagellin FlaB